MAHDLVVSDGMVVSPELGRLRADVAADGETITNIAEPGTLDGDCVIDASDKYVFPGVVDPHTHHGIYNDIAVDAESESRSGLVGGVTTIGNFFRRGESYREVMDDYLGETEPNYYHDYFFSLGLLSSTHVDELPYIVEELGITSFKWYMNYKHAAVDKFGVDRDMTEDFADDIIQALTEIDAPTTVGYHSENIEITSVRQERAKEAGRTGYEALLDGFPGYAEAQSMLTGAGLAGQHGYDDSFYIVHISSGRTADELARLQESGYGTMGETCPHYLTLTAEDSDDRMKVNPPVRTEDDKETLWQRIADGTIDCIGTDHVTNSLDEKVGDDIWESNNGFPSSATMLPLILSEGVHEGRISLERAVEITSTNAAKAWNLYPKKGTIRIGSDADLAILDLEETKTITPDLLKSGGDYTIYDGREVIGWPTHTVVRGQVAYENGDVIGEKGYGTHVDRPVDA